MQSCPSRYFSARKHRSHSEPLPIPSFTRVRFSNGQSKRLSISARSSTSRSLPLPKLPTSRMRCRRIWRNSRAAESHWRMALRLYECRQPFDEMKHRHHTLKEVVDVAEGKYDWKIEQKQQNISR